MVCEVRDISARLNPEAPSSYGKYHLPENEAAPVIVDGGEVTIPAGFGALLVQPRKCGDYYAELSGKPAFAAYGETRLEAVRAVVSRAESAAL